MNFLTGGILGRSFLTQSVKTFFIVFFIFYICGLHKIFHMKFTYIYTINIFLLIFYQQKAFARIPPCAQTRS